MVVSTINSAGGKFQHHEGTKQEVIDAMDTGGAGHVLAFGHTGAAYFALIRRTAPP